MKIGLYSPYLPKHYGGGEKHLLTSAWYLSQKHEVYLHLPEVSEATRTAIQKYETLFGLDLSRVILVDSPLARGTNGAFQNWRLTQQYDAFLYLTDGSIFLSGAKKSILHIQVPFTHSQNGLVKRLKLRSWNRKNANSFFTKNVVERAWKTEIPFVHYPFADTEHIPFDPLKRRERRIIAVGRFLDPAHTTLHAKRQDALVEAFLAGCKRWSWQDKGWQLHLIGAIEPGAVHEAFVRELQRKSEGYPVFFHHDVSHEELAHLYQSSSLFWHAAGLGVDEEQEPQRVEHFGMTAIEAMAHGCIPLVTNKGGLKETVTHGQNGFRFESVDELVQLTNEVLGLSPQRKRELRQEARRTAKTFSLERFCRTLDTMLEGE